MSKDHRLIIYDPTPPDRHGYVDCYTRLHYGTVKFFVRAKVHVNDIKEERHYYNATKIGDR